MKIYNRITLCVIIALALPAIGSAQYLRTAYFMDKSTVRTAMNPALRPERGYVAIPAIGSLSAGFGGNSLAVSDILYPRNGELVTFLDPSVSTGDFLGRLKDNNRIDADLAMSIISAGWFSGKNFWTLDVGMKTIVNTNIPKSLFEFMKRGSGLEGRSYSVKNLEVSADAYAEVGLGFSRPINSRLTVGGKVKALVGAGNANVYFDNMDIRMNGDSWTVNSTGRLDVSMKGLSPEFDTDDQELEYIDGFDIDTPGVSGYGAAIDLGASYQLLDNLMLSASILDFGFISWDKGSTVSARAHGDFLFDGFNIPVGDQETDDNSVSDQFDDMADDLQDLMHFRQTKSKGRSTMLRTTLNIGGEYSMFDNRLGFGLLSTTRFNATKASTELTVSVNYRPVNWFATSVSYSIVESNFNTFGFALNFSPSWINFFLGTDYVPLKVSTQNIPINLRASNFYFGFAIPLSKQKSDKQ